MNWVGGTRRRILEKAKRKKGFCEMRRDDKLKKYKTSSLPLQENGYDCNSFQVTNIFANINANAFPRQVVKNGKSKNHNVPPASRSQPFKLHQENVVPQKSESKGSWRDTSCKTRTETIMLTPNGACFNPTISPVTEWGPRKDFLKKHQPTFQASPWNPAVQQPVENVSPFVPFSIPRSVFETPVSKIGVPQDANSYDAEQQHFPFSSKQQWLWESPVTTSTSSAGGTFMTSSDFLRTSKQNYLLPEKKHLSLLKMEATLLHCTTDRPQQLHNFFNPNADEISEDSLSQNYSLEEPQDYRGMALESPEDCDYSGFVTKFPERPSSTMLWKGCGFDQEYQSGVPSISSSTTTATSSNNHDIKTEWRRYPPLQRFYGENVPASTGLPLPSNRTVNVNTLEGFCAVEMGDEVVVHKPNNVSVAVQTAVESCDKPVQCDVPVCEEKCAKCNLVQVHKPSYASVAVQTDAESCDIVHGDVLVRGEECANFNIVLEQMHMQSEE
uniref:uncharacterized protein n=1 Tax=Myxine glutinosa TaxID=7769 RepID=UPI00358E690F